MIYAVCGGAAGLIIGVVFIVFITATQNAAVRRRAKRTTAGKRPFEFSKLLAVWAAVIGTAALVASFVLAAFDKQPVSDLAVAVFTACIGYMVTYAGKSAYEKNSRNKHGLDADGQPFDTPEGE